MLGSLVVVNNTPQQTNKSEPEIVVDLRRIVKELLTMLNLMED
jgi:hypothetical protein